MIRYWKLEGRNWEYPRDSFVNGLLAVPLRLPHVPCPENCGNPWNSLRRLPFDCPPEMREEMELIREKGWESIALKDFQRRAMRWESILRRNGHDLSRLPPPAVPWPSRDSGESSMQLLPGDAFGAPLWMVPSIPRYDFFWLSPELIVSERIKDIFEIHDIAGISFLQVELQRVGRAEPRDELTEEYTNVKDSRGRHVAIGLPEYFDHVPCVEDPPSCGKFFQLIIHHESRPRDADYVSGAPCVCGCGEETEEYEQRRDELRERCLLPKSEICDADIFWSHFQRHVINDNVRSLLQKEQLLNCKLTPLTVCEG